MKPNDKAIEAALLEAKIIFPEEEMSEYVQRVLDAAYAAQFQSEDYAGLVKELKAFDEELLNSQPHSCERVAKDAADAIEALLAERDAAIREGGKDNE